MSGGTVTTVWSVPAGRLSGDTKRLTLVVDARVGIVTTYTRD